VETQTNLFATQPEPFGVGLAMLAPFPTVLFRCTPLKQAQKPMQLAHVTLANNGSTWCSLFVPLTMTHSVKQAHQKPQRINMATDPLDTRHQLQYSALRYSVQLSFTPNTTIESIHVVLMSSLFTTQVQLS
jgi:hypothetical protein